MTKWHAVENIEGQSALVRVNVSVSLMIRLQVGIGPILVHRSTTGMLLVPRNQLKERLLTAHIVEAYIVSRSEKNGFRTQKWVSLRKMNKHMG